MGALSLDQQRAVALASARARAAEATPAPSQSLGQQVGSYADGIYAGLHSLPQSVAELGARGLDATGLTDNSYKNLRGAFQDMNSIAANGQTDNRFYKGGQVAGQVVSSLPALELKAPAAVAGALPKVAGFAGGLLPKLATGAGQGMAASAITSNTSEAPLGEQLALGAAGGAALPLLGAGVRAAGNGAATFLGGVTTGAGANSIKGAFEAGLAGGEQGKAFTDSMRGNTPWSQVVNDAKSALGNMREARNKAYRSGMQDISKDATVLSFEPVDAELAKTASVKNFKGKDLSPKTADVRKEVDDAIADWKASDPAEYHTPEGFDALKQKLGGIADSYQFHSPERIVADNAYNAVKKAISKQAPVYDKVMGDYSSASAQIKEIEKELSLNPKANVNTALRKLQSVMRDNVNTSWGDRAKYADLLADNGAKNLIPSLAGQALSTAIPRGLKAPALDAMLMGGAGLTGGLPAMAALPFASPRLMGEAAYGLGSVGRGIDAGATGLFGSTAPRSVLNSLRGLSAPAFGATLPALLAPSR